MMKKQKHSWMKIPEEQMKSINKVRSESKMIS